MAPVHGLLFRGPPDRTAMRCHGISLDNIAGNHFANVFAPVKMLHCRANQVVWLYVHDIKLFARQRQHPDSMNWVAQSKFV